MTFLPECLLAVGTAALAWRARKKGPFAGMGPWSALLLTVAGGLILGLWVAHPAAGLGGAGWWQVDGTTHMGRALVLASVLLAFLLADRSADRPPYLFVWLPVYALAGMGVISATHLASWWLSWMAWGAVTLGLVGFPRGSRAFKLLLWLEGLSTGFAGLAALSLWGASGEGQFESIAQALSLQELLPGGALLSGIFILLAVGLKWGVFPLHQWRMDACRFATPPVWALLLSGQLAIGALALFRLWTVPLSHDMLELKLIPVWMGVSVVSMLAGALLALVQRNLHRLVFSVAMSQVGFWLVGLIASQSPHTFYGALEGALFQLLAMLAAQAAVLAVLVTVLRESGSHHVHGLDGLYRRSPFLALVLTGGLLSWLGFPPSAGFVANLDLMSVVSQGGDGWLAGVAGGTHVLWAALLFQMLRRMYGRPPVDEAPWRVPQAGVRIVMLGALFLLGALLLAPGWFRAWIGSAVTLF